MKRVLVGVLVGGRAVRFGGTVKGLLPAPDTNEPIVSRLARICRSALPSSEVVLVGDASAYARLALESIADDPPGVGPIGALAALLSESRRRNRDAVALACDLPFVSPELVLRLCTHAPDANAVAPRTSGLWQPLFARYRSDAALAAASAVMGEGGRALHRVLSYLGSTAVELPLSPEEQRLLRDWDSPDDLAPQ